MSLHHSPLSPHVRVASFYGPHTIRDKHAVEPVLDTLLKDNCILPGDYNGVTQSGHTTALRPNLWPWLIAKERSRALSDLLAPHCHSTTYTRVRRYGGTKCYIDRGHGTRTFCALFQSTAASVLDFFSVNGAQDHDPIVIHTVPWSTPNVPPPRCGQWNRRDVQRFQRHIEQLTPSQPVPDTYSEVEATYATLCAHMLTAMNTVNEAKPDPSRSSCDITDCTSVVPQLAKQAKRRSKIFYRRDKHTLLSPPAQSTSPVPSRKIQRILQRNNPWSTEAGQHIPQYPQLDNPAPPTYDALRTLARAARKKSPGPDGIPPHLLSILPATTFATVHACVSLCYQTGDIPLPWLVSETLCLYKGKGSWQDPDRWRPIAMSNFIYRLLMRWVYRRFGTPLRLLRLISLALEYGATYIRGCPESVFRTTHGVKQGCPLSCFLFVIAFRIPLPYLHVRGIPFSAYVDDISSPALRGRSPHVSTTVQEDLALIGCQLNIIKSEALPVACPPPRPTRRAQISSSLVARTGINRLPVDQSTVC